MSAFAMHRLSDYVQLAPSWFRLEIERLLAKWGKKPEDITHWEITGKRVGAGLPTIQFSGLDTLTPTTFEIVAYLNETERFTATFYGPSQEGLI